MPKLVGMTDGMDSRPTPRTRRKARHLLDNYYIDTARDPAVLEIWAYSDKYSYQPGETVSFHVNTTADTWALEIGRDGLVYEPLHSKKDLPGVCYDTPADCSVTGCGWPVACTFTIPGDWKSGGYLVTLTGVRGDEQVEEHHLFMVRRSETAGRAPILFLCATGTWAAYNCWGGSNSYDGITGPDGDRFSPVLSLERPWTRGFCKLPAGAPRTVRDIPNQPDEMARYPHMEWAYSYGYSKKYASAGWASYDRHFVRWAEKAGYAVDVATLHDLHDNPDLLDGYACAVSVGHDEYWSAEMRDAVDAWVENGGNFARFAGNFLWQIRLQNDGKTQVCYKYIAVEEDPYMGTDRQHLLTGAWEMPQVNRPGARTFGVNALTGVYACFGKCVVGDNAGFTIYRDDHWAFAGTSLRAGDVLGPRSRIYGYEVDGVHYRMEDGLPVPLCDDGAAAELDILAVGPASNTEDDNGVWGEVLYLEDSEAQWKAKYLLQDGSPEGVARAAPGNGMIIHWPRGRGQVFTAATCEWVMGLTREDAQVEQITRNVLDRFTGIRA